MYGMCVSTRRYFQLESRGMLHSASHSLSLSFFSSLLHWLPNKMFFSSVSSLSLSLTPPRLHTYVPYMHTRPPLIAYTLPPFLRFRSRTLLQIHISVYIYYIRTHLQVYLQICMHVYSPNLPSVKKFTAFKLCADISRAREKRQVSVYLYL